MKNSKFTTDRREELLNEVAKLSHLKTEEVAIYLEITSNDVRGLRRTLTVRNNKNSQLDKEVKDFKKNEKKTKKYEGKILDVIANGLKNTNNNNGILSSIKKVKKEVPKEVKYQKYGLE